MNFLTKEQYLACLSCVTCHECILMFWKLLFEINSQWNNLTTLVVDKKEWDRMFRSIDGLPYTRTRIKADGNREVAIRIRALEGKPVEYRHHCCHPIELLVYPFAVPLWDGRYKSHDSSRKIIKKYLVYLDEVRQFVKKWGDNWELERLLCTTEGRAGFWIRRFDHREHKYQDLDKMIKEARDNLKKLEVLQKRIELRKR